MPSFSPFAPDRRGICSLLFVISGCGGGSPSPAAPTSPVPTSDSRGPTAASGAAPASASRGTGAASANEEDDPIPPDPSENPEHIVLAPLFTKANPPKFPKQSVSDHDCWQGMELSGDARKDYDTLIAHCGAPTGVVEYARPAMGHLHHKHDQRDSFKLKLAAGYCYRYFAVGDSTIEDLDILIERYGGDIVGDDQAKSPVAIIKSDAPWCMDEDASYDFDVAVNGKGQGNYVLGVWARPK